MTHAIAVSPDQYKQLCEYSQRHGQTVDETINDAINDYITSTGSDTGKGSATEPTRA